MKKLLGLSLKYKFAVFFFTALIVVSGVLSFMNTAIDAFPDVTNTQVTIITQWQGRSAEEIEKFVTAPLEISMNGVQKKTSVHRNFEGCSYKFLNFLGTSALPLRNDGHLRISYVWKGINGSIHEAQHARNHDESRKKEDRKFIFKGKSQ